MHILEEFWHENINPAEKHFQKQRGFDKMFRMLTKNEEKLHESLNEQKRIAWKIQSLLWRNDTNYRMLNLYKRIQIKYKISYGLLESEDNMLDE